MQINEVFKQLNAININENEAEIIEENIPMKIKISTSNTMFCNINISTKCEDNIANKSLLEVFNKYEKMAKFYIDDNTLNIQTSLWVDRKVTKSGLSQVIEIMIAKMLSILLLMEHNNG